MLKLCLMEHFQNAMYTGTIGLIILHLTNFRGKKFHAIPFNVLAADIILQYYNIGPSLFVFFFFI